SGTRSGRSSSTARRAHPSPTCSGSSRPGSVSGGQNRRPCTSPEGRTRSSRGRRVARAHQGYSEFSRTGGTIQGRIVVVGASAGGVEALIRLVKDLPGDLPAPLLVVLHVAPTGTSVLPAILSRAGDLGATHAEDGAPMRQSCIYVAPPGRHLVVEDGVMRLDAGPKENGHRPAVDPLFRSAAHQIGSQAVGLILSGVLDDGSAGLRSLRAHGGIAIV